MCVLEMYRCVCVCAEGEYRTCVHVQSLDTWIHTHKTHTHTLLWYIDLDCSTSLVYYTMCRFKDT